MKFSGSDLAVGAGALLGAAVLSALFIADLNAFSVRSGEQELGSILFKKLSATRKAADGLAWERVRNNSPVYEADTLRTAAFSEAEVVFGDGTNLDLLENSMIKLGRGAKAKDLELLSGEISVGSSETATSYTISSAAGKINVDKGAKVTFSRDSDKLSVEVVRGGASLLGRDGTTREIGQFQELQVDVKNGESSVVSRPVIPVAPERNARLLSFSGGGTAVVDFAWLEGAAQGAAQEGVRSARDRGAYTVEVAADKDFTENVESFPASGLAARSSVASGIRYWRVRDGAGAVSPVRRFTLEIAEQPAPAFPPDGKRYEYRRIKPDIGFAWTGMDGAAAYLLEVASEPSFAKPVVRSRTTVTALAVDTLGEGRWFWRVTPIHAFSVLGTVPAAASRSVVVAVSPAMGEPTAIAPLAGSLYQIQDADGKGLDFSWNPEPEAVSYELVVAKTKDLSAPFRKFKAAHSFLKLSGAAAEGLERPGSYYWGVRWMDKEGNASPLSPARALQGVDGSIALRPTFPPDGYRIADSLARSTRFAWKSNVAAPTVLQVAKDAAFASPVLQEPANADTMLGRDWKVGRYYWRLRAFNADGSVFLETPARGFEVVEPFPGPALTKPAPGAGFYLRERETLRFSWNPVPRADYYNLTLRGAADGYKAALFERSFLVEPSFSNALGDLPSGSYRLSVQAFASSGEASTRIIGYLGENEFSFKRVSSIRLESPADGDHAAGLDARSGRIPFVYSLEDRPDAAELLVSRDPAGTDPVSRTGDRSGRAFPGRLDPGTYYWTVAGRLGGYDVSSPERRRLVVDAPPPAPGPVLASPADATLYPLQDPDAQGLGLSWAPEAEAVSYEVAVSRSRDLSSPAIQVSTPRPALALTGFQAAPLSGGGVWYWGVRWKNRENDVSLWSVPRSLRGADAADAARPSFPPDGYRIADAQIRNARFAWKSALDARVDFQVARDPRFQDVLLREPCSADSASGRDWSPGLYYWRLLTINADGSVFRESAVRSFEVAGALAKPVLAQPRAGSSVAVREGSALTVSWAPVPGADTYSLALRSAADGYRKALYEKANLDSPQAACPLGDLPSGAYRLSVQAGSTANAASTALAGLAGDCDFSCRRIPAIKLESPAEGARLNGLDARRGKAVFSYRADEKPEAGELLIYADAAGTKPAVRAPARDGRAAPGRLDPGTYFWTVAGSSAGVDVSAAERRRFVVDAPAPLPAPGLKAPAPNAVVGAAQLRAKRSIFFSWLPVPGAGAYVLSVYPEGSRTPIVRKAGLTSPAFSLEDLSLLDRGRFAWTVEAQSFDAAGELERGGAEARASFEIDLPAARKANAGSGDAFYGR